MDKNEIKNLIEEFLGKARLEVLEVDHNTEDFFGPMGFSVKVKDHNLFLDRGGEGVSALNHLIRKIVENKYLKDRQTENQEEVMDSGDSSDERDGLNQRNTLNIIVDINDFQKKRIESLRSLAHMMAERARYFKSNIEMDPMSSFERRVVHEFLSEAEDLDTESQGFGKGRKIVIKYKGGI